MGCSASAMHLGKALDGEQRDCWWIVLSSSWALSTKAGLSLGALLGRKQDQPPDQPPTQPLKLSVRGS